MNLNRALPVAAVLALTFATVLTGCSSTPVDADGRWIGGAATMTAWAHRHVPVSWERVREKVIYADIIDDYDKDTHRDSTEFVGKYRGVAESEFARFGVQELEIRQPLECEPYDPKAPLEEKPYVKFCTLSLYQGQSPLPREFDLFAVWTGFADGTTTVDLYLNNDPR